MSASNEKVICRKVCFKRLTKFQVKKKKGLIGLQDSYQDRFVLFNVHMYDEFHVPDVLIVLLTVNSQGVLIQMKAILSITDRRFPEAIPGNFISTSMLCIIFAQLAYCCCS